METGRALRIDRQWPDFYKGFSSVKTNSNYSKNGRKVKIIPKIRDFAAGFLFCLLSITLLRRPVSSETGFFPALSLLTKGRPGHLQRGGLEFNPDYSVKTSVSPVTGRPVPPQRGGPCNNIPFISMTLLTEAACRETADGPAEDGTGRGGQRSDADHPAFISTHTTIHGKGGLEPSLDSPPLFDWLDTLLEKIVIVESGGQLNPEAGDDGRSVGILQIGMPAIKDVNKFYGTNFKSEDRRDIEKSKLIARLYLSYWLNYHKAEICSKIWVGGPDGWRQKCTEDYWQKIKKNKVMPGPARWGEAGWGWVRCGGVWSAHVWSGKAG